MVKKNPDTGMTSAQERANPILAAARAVHRREQEEKAMKNDHTTRSALRKRVAESPVLKRSQKFEFMQILGLLAADEAKLKTDSPENRVRREAEVQGQLANIERALEQG